MSVPRIAIFMQDLAGGGAERAMVNLMHGLVQAGVAVDLVVVRQQGPYLADVPPAVRVVALGCGRTWRSIGPLARYLQREQPQAMLSALVHVNVAAVLAKKRAGVATRLLVCEQNHVSTWIARSRPSLPVRVCHHLRGWAYRQADGIVAVSEGVADDLANVIRLPRQRVQVIHNPVVTDALLRRSQEPLDHPWLRAGQPPVILGVGRLAVQKNFPLLIKAFAQVRRHRPVRLVILGQGSLHEPLQALVAQLGLQQDVLLPGFADNPFAWMRHSRLFVLSSDFEGLPTVLIEAMACGSAVVATDCPSGPREILDAGRHGRLVPVGDLAAMSQAMLAALDEPIDAAALQARASHYATSTVTRRYLAAMLPGEPPWALSSEARP